MKKNLLLTQLGFTKNEALVYESLLKLGKAKVATIVRESGLHRPLVYKALPQLIEKHLVSVMPRGKVHEYAAESPEKLEALFKEREVSFFRSIEDLHGLYDKQEKKPRITVTEGADAIREAYATMIHSLKKGETYYRYGSTKALRKKYIPKDYREVRDKKQLERLVITNVPSKLQARDRLGRTIKVIPPEYDLFEYDISQMIYNDRVVVADYNTNTVITIDNPVIAQFQRKLFKLLFNKL